VVLGEFGSDLQLQSTYDIVTSKAEFTQPCASVIKQYNLVLTIAGMLDKQVHHAYTGHMSIICSFG